MTQVADGLLAQYSDIGLVSSGVHGRIRHREEVNDMFTLKSSATATGARVLLGSVAVFIAFTFIVLTSLITVPQVTAQGALADDPLSVYIVGPSEQWEHPHTCAYVAYASGGTTPYTFDWGDNTTSFSSSSTWYADVSITTDTWVPAWVFDDAEDYAYDFLYVEVGPADLDGCAQ